jgi:hypothetical protein
MIMCTEIKFTQHALDRIKQRDITINKAQITINYIKQLPYYTDNGCIKYLDWSNQVIYYIRNNNKTFTLETIIKTNPIQMLRNLCDAYRMLCVNKHHPNNKCIYCNLWKFNNICRDNLFGACKRHTECRYFHTNLKCVGE